MINLEIQQILLPKKVYIGDTAELRCSFNSNSFTLKNFVENGSVQLSSSGFISPLDMQDYDIKSITLSSIGVDHYQLSINFVPWKIGDITFPGYDLTSNFTEPELSSSDFDEHYLINFQPVNIVSLTQQDSITSLRPGAAPLLLPGTTYKLYGALVIFVFALFLIVRSIIKHEEIAFYLRNRKLLRKYKKNRRHTEKALARLLVTGKKQAPLDDKAFAQNFQQILRTYLEVRFDIPFSKIVTSSFMRAFNEAFGGSEDFTSLMSERKENACIQITSLFTRTDYIRYSGEAALNEGERAELVESAKECISDFEEGEKEKAGGEKNV